jgi:iron complex transport system ATP-binding protein
MTALFIADSIALRRGDRKILSSATLRAEAGKVTALLGRNGAGKSTLLRVAAGELASDGGTLFLNGTPIDEPSAVRCRRMGVLLLGDPPPLPRNWSTARFAGFVSSWTNMPFTTTHGTTSIAALSTGERRLLALRTAVALDARVLLLDEPTRDLAPAAAEQVMQVAQTAARAGCAVVIASHETTLLFAYADRVTLCYAGSTTELGTADEAQSAPMLQREYFGRSA